MIPKRAVRSGLISQRGNLDHDLGGDTSRYAFTAALDFNRLAIAAYAIDYDFTLYSNFSYFLNDPVLGDELEQRDKRRIYRLNLTGGTDESGTSEQIRLSWGANLRFDDIQQVGLYDTNGRNQSKPGKE